MVGMEDPIFPSKRAVTEQGNFEEERRLFYVGITRAKDLLFLSRADSRMLYGRPNYNPPSLFLHEVPDECVRSLDQAKRDWGEQASRKQAEERAGKPRARIFKENRANEPPAPQADAGGLFPIGARVKHSRLGPGQVVGASGEGDRRKVAVRFDAGVELEVLERYGGLETLPEEGLPF
jgi:DNA helicase-2/ATP-dependent DNA helicase PcrA